MKDVRRIISKYRSWATLAVFVIIFVGCIIYGTWGLKAPVAAVCTMMVIQAVMAAVLHRAELWVHGLVLIAEIVAGVVVKQLVIVLLGLMVYIAATMTIQILTEKGRG